MNKKLRISMIVVVTVVLLMSVTIQSLAEKPDKFFTLEAIYEFSGDTLTYSGTFDSEGAIADEGTSWGHWVLTQGGDFRLTSFFQSNELTQDMFVVAIRLDDELDEENCLDGMFTIFSNLGTGEYYGLWGKGRASLCRPNLDNTGELNLEGIVDIVTYP